MEPIATPSSLLIPKRLARPTPTRFCTTRKATAPMARIRPSLPLFFSTAKLQVKPVPVKNRFIKKSWRVLFISTVKVFVWTPMKMRMLQIRPPMTGAGIKKIRKNFTLRLMKLPSRNTSTARPTVWMMSSLMTMGSASFIYLGVSCFCGASIQKHK